MNFKNQLLIAGFLVYLGANILTGCKKEDVPMTTAQLLDYSTNLPISNGRIEVINGSGGDTIPDAIVYSDSNGYFTYPQYEQLAIKVSKDGYWNPHLYSWDHYDAAIETIFLFRQGVAKIVLTNDPYLTSLNNRVRVTVGDSGILNDYMSTGNWLDTTISVTDSSQVIFYVPTIDGAVNVVQNLREYYGAPGQFIWKPYQDSSFMSVEGDTAVIDFDY